MKHLRFLALSTCLVTIAACQTMDGFIKDIDALDLPSMSMSESSPEQLVYEGKCPHVEIVDELSAFNDFTDENNPSEANLISRANITKVNTSCTYDERSVTVDLKMAFEGNLGPRARTRSNEKPYFSYPFFVAVTGAGGDIMAKEIFAASMTYPSGQNQQTYYENMRQIIPVESRDRGSRYKILIGFQLSPDQLSYNREHAVKEEIKAQLQEELQEQVAKEVKPQAIQAKPQTIRLQPSQQYIKPNEGNPIDITN